jgi:hypothetical protein
VISGAPADLPAAVGRAPLPARGRGSKVSARESDPKRRRWKRKKSWARSTSPFAAAVRRNGGVLIGFQRVPVEDLIESLEAAEAAA